MSEAPNLVILEALRPEWGVLYVIARRGRGRRDVWCWERTFSVMGFLVSAERIWGVWGNERFISLFKFGNGITKTFSINCLRRWREAVLSEDRACGCRSVIVFCTIVKIIMMCWFLRSLYYFLLATGGDNSHVSFPLVWDILGFNGRDGRYAAWTSCITVCFGKVGKILRHDRWWGCMVWGWELGVGWLFVCQCDM